MPRCTALVLGSALLVSSCARQDDRSGLAGQQRTVEFIPAESGKPNVVGCSDGQREALPDLDAYPSIAGCAGPWAKLASLRDPPTTSQACGDDAEPCPTPADLCAQGWHVCMSDGDRVDLAERLGFADCRDAGPGAFVAASSHTAVAELPCRPILKTSMFDCRDHDIGSEPVCCGADCRPGLCRDAVWLGHTEILMGHSCGEARPDPNIGVLCCRD